MPSPRYYSHVKRKSPRLSGPEAAGLYAEVSKLVNDSGLFSFQVKFRPHYFRHNLAVYLRDELHWDPREIQLILRQTSVDTTTQFYFHDKPKNPDEYVLKGRAPRRDNGGLALR